MATATLLASCRPESRGGDASDGARRAPAADRATTLTVQHPYSGITGEQMTAIWEAYEAAMPEVGIEALQVENDLAGNQRLFAAVAAGTPPDVTWVDGPQVAEWAVRGVLNDLSAYVEAAGVRVDDFWPPCWRQTVYAGNVWALTYTADANFGFFWNRALLAEAGLDPEQPPATIDALTALNEQIIQGTGSSLARMGIIPWNTYGTANAIFTWGWIFGGAFFDPDTSTITADHERNIMALEWMLAIADAAGGYEAVLAFSAGENPFYDGRVATALLGAWELPNMARAAPELDYGITHAPTGPQPAEPRSSWVGGWCTGIPHGAVQTDAAWAFIHWLCATDAGTSLFGELFNQTPGYKKSSWYAVLEAQQPEMQQFVDILREARHQRPVMPAQGFYMGALQRHVDAALRGEASAEQALRAARRETQAELDRILHEGFGET
jgi:multiple sugar transport system substrate-binding protein